MHRSTCREGFFKTCPADQGIVHLPCSYNELRCSWRSAKGASSSGTVGTGCAVHVPHLPGASSTPEGSTCAGQGKGSYYEGVDDVSMEVIERELFDLEHRALK